MAEQTFTSLGGSDIHAVFGNYKFASIQMIRYASSREKAQIYTLGSPTARATARGKRSISGAFVFTLIDRDGLTKAMSKAAGAENRVFLSNDELANFANSGKKETDPTVAAARTALMAGGTTANVGLIGSKYSPFTSDDVFNPANFGTSTEAFVADQLLPFDITVVGTPEYGGKDIKYHSKRLVIHGVEILTEASGTSIDDLVIEKQNSFIARSISDWTPLSSISGATGSGTQ